jgi:transposase
MGLRNLIRARFKKESPVAIVFVGIDLAKAEERSERLMQIAGIGATTASALVASVGNGHDFASGRQLAAWLGLAWLGLAWLGLAWLGLVWFGLVWFGLVPGQYSSGDDVG